jgi:hypothetical protein
MREIKDGIELLSTLLSKLQGKAVAGDLERLARLLERLDDMSVAQFCTLVEKAVEGGAEQPTRTATSRQKARDDALIQQYLDELRQSEGSLGSFESVVSRINKDKKMRIVELKALADIYLGVEGTYAKKQEAIKAILDKRSDDASVQRRLKGIPDIF